MKTEEEQRAALLALSFDGAQTWVPHLESEIEIAYTVVGLPGYVRGTEPKSEVLDEHRRRCIEYARSMAIVDRRRLWTWEARAFASAHVGDVVAVVLSPEAHKVFDHLCREGGMPPDDVRIIVGRASGGSIYHFEEDEVAKALEGTWP